MQLLCIRSFAFDNYIFGTGILWSKPNEPQVEFGAKDLPRIKPPWEVISGVSQKSKKMHSAILNRMVRFWGHEEPCRRFTKKPFSHKEDQSAYNRLCTYDRLGTTTAYVLPPSPQTKVLCFGIYIIFVWPANDFIIGQLDIWQWHQLKRPCEVSNFKYIKHTVVPT